MDPAEGSFFVLFKSFAGEIIFKSVIQITISGTKKEAEIQGNVPVSLFLMLYLFVLFKKWKDIRLFLDKLTEKNEKSCFA